MTDSRLMKSGSPLLVWKYMSKEFLLTFFVCFFLFFVMFFVNQILYMAKDFLEKRAPLWNVLLLLVYAMPSFAALSFPFATLVSSLMSMGRLTSDNEILVMQASGISLKKIFVPFLVLGMAFTMASFVMNDVLMPLGTINYSKAYRRLMNSTPSLVLKPFSVNKFENTTIVTGKVEGDTVESAMIFDSGEGRASRVITAKKAMLGDAGQGESVISLTLDGVFVMETNPANRNRYEYSSSDRMIYNILVRDIMESSGGGTAPSQMSSFDLGKVVAAKQKAFRSRLEERALTIAQKRYTLAGKYLAQLSRPGVGGQAAWLALQQEYDDLERLSTEKITDKNMLSYEREYHKKFAIPFGAICFVILAFPVGLLVKKSGRMVGLIVGLGVSFIYWVLMYGSDTIASRLPYPPFWLMWFPNILVLSLATGAFILGRLKR